MSSSNVALTTPTELPPFPPSVVQSSASSSITGRTDPIANNIHLFASFRITYLQCAYKNCAICMCFVNGKTVSFLSEWGEMRLSWEKDGQVKLEM
jgi:hypothetical protein